MKKREVLNR